MAKILYVAKKFNAERRLVIDHVNAIISQFSAAGFTLSLRQIYYQLIAKDLFPDTWISKEGTKNNEANYDRLGNIVSAGRRAGLIDWDAVEDRTRSYEIPSSWSSPSSIVGACAEQFRIDMWRNQPYHVAVFVEKQAVEEIVQMACEHRRVEYFACRGYVSDSSIHSAAQRFAGAVKRGKTPLVLHLGDHDPSGIDMTRDIRDRLELFAGSSIDVRRIALNMDQIDQYSPPPNPAKTTDSRYAGYRATYGEESWELDALEPAVIMQLIRNEVEAVIDQDAWDAEAEAEDEHRRRLKAVADRWEETADYAESL